MTDDRDEKSVVDHSARVVAPADGKSKAMILREKSMDAAAEPPAAATQVEATSARHRAWLRQVARRAR